MNTVKKILLAILFVVVAIQFIRPGRNVKTDESAVDIFITFNIPDSVHSILKKACFDCHSNNTRYPWYSNIQPVGWFLSRHIKDGKEELNFSEFGNYSQRRQVSKLEGIAVNVREDLMPLKSYRLLHKEARLQEDEKAQVIRWAENSGAAIPETQ